MPADIPTTILEQAGNDFDAVVAQAQAKEISPFIYYPVALVIWAADVFVWTLGPVVIYLFTLFAPKLVGLFLKFLADLRAKMDPQVAELAVDVLNEMTGAEFSTQDLPTGQDPASHIDRASAVGGRLCALLEREFAPAGTIDPDQGTKAASTFVGFGINFAVANAMITILGELASVGYIKELRELGVEVAQNIGLGRLVRQALRPLVQTTISDPITWALNKKYHPTLLNPAEATRAFLSGDLDAPSYVEEVERRGYDQTRRNALQHQHTTYPTEAQLYLLELTGDIQESDHITYLRMLGYSDETIPLVRKAESHELTRRLSFELAHRLVPYVLNGEIDQDTYESVISRFTFSQEEKTALVGFINELKSHPTRRITLAQMQKSVEIGYSDIGELQDFLTAKGYTSDDAQIILYETLLTMSNTKAAATAKAAKTAATAAKAAATTPAPPTTTTG
jgi:hypothetical protein